jgi:hypothetical protein
MRAPAALFAVLLAGFAPAAPAAEDPAPKVPPRFTLTFTERIRQESQDNVTGLSQDAADGGSYLRFRSSLMGKWLLTERLSLTVRLTNENRFYLVPKTDPRNGRDYNPGEVFFDYLNLRSERTFGLPLTLTVGRQDLMLGEGLVIRDGGPLDGSRSAYFNALRGDWAWGPKAVLTAFYCYQPPYDDFLPLLNDARQKMVEQAERGAGLYFTGMVGTTGLDAYLIRKTARAEGVWSSLALTTAGARIVLPITSRLSLAAEGAAQSGRYGAADRTGLAGTLRLDFKTGASFPLPAVLTAGGFFLSGDDPATSGRYEGWDPVFARWPLWSESFIFRMGRENGKSAYWSNISSLYGRLRFVLADNFRLETTLHSLGAPRKEPLPAGLGGGGLFRGRLLNLKLTYEVNQNVSGHFWVDGFWPGDYYFAGAHGYAWIRFELMFRY